MTTPPVAVVCAMPMEQRPLTKRLRLRRTSVGGMTAREGRVDHRPVVSIVTGMGTALAAARTARLLDAVTPTWVLVVGITGAVDDLSPIGSLVVPEVVIDAATGRQHRPRPIDGHPPKGAMWTTDVITRADEIPALRTQGVVSLDMETAAIAQQCEQRDVPWSVIRSISDRATDGSVDDEVFGLSHQDGTPNPRTIVRYVIRHPHRIPGMVRLAKGAQLATGRAADAAIAAVRSQP